MVLTIGLLALILSALGAGLALRISRNPRMPSWLRDDFICLLYVPLVIGVLAVGIGHVVYGVSQLVYGYASLWTLDTLYSGVLAATLVLGLRWQPAKQIIFGRAELPNATEPKLELTAAVQTPIIESHDPDAFRSAA